jgi:cytoskeleton protein RodZ
MPSLAKLQSDKSPPFRIGSDLRTARERLEWELPAIAAHLRIRPAMLAAFEAGRIAELPPGAYALGHLRTYARALGLDPNEVVRRFQEEARDVTLKPRLSFPAPVAERGVPAGAVVLVGALLAIGAYTGWYQMSGNRPGEEPVRQVPQRLAALVQPPAVTVPAPVPAPPPVIVAAVDPAPPPISMPAVPPGSAAAAIPAAGAFSPPLAPPSATLLPSLPEGTRIVIRAKADAWLQVRDRQGPVLLNRVLHPGETWPVPVQKAPGQLVMTTGNAGGTELLVDGQLTPALGNDGAVRRDLALDPDAVRDGKLAGPTAANAAGARPAAKLP